MELKVTKKQNNTTDCIVCGLHNDASLHTRFYELEGNIICGIFHNESRIGGVAAFSDFVVIIAGA